MLEWTLKRINRAIKRHDRELYAIAGRDGKIVILRKRLELVRYDLEGQTLAVSTRADLQVLSLTHNWSPKGRPVEWGIEPLMAKLREIDAWNDTHDGGVVARLERDDARHEESKRRAARSLHENMAYEQHGVFRKALKDINVSTLSKNVATKGMRRNGYL